MDMEQKRLRMKIMIANFVWGEVIANHEIGDIDVVEYESIVEHKDHKGTCFHPYIDSKDTMHGYLSLEEAVIGAIAIKYDGPNTQAGKFFCKMIGLKK